MSDDFSNLLDQHAEAIRQGFIADLEGKNKLIRQIEAELAATKAQLIEAQAECARLRSILLECDGWFESANIRGPSQLERIVLEIPSPTTALDEYAAQVLREAAERLKQSGDSFDCCYAAELNHLADQRLAKTKRDDKGES